MKENIVTFQVAKLAKEKGFDGYCYDAYNKHGMQYSNGWCEYIDDNEEDIPFNKSILRNNDVLAPTQSLLQKWLREEHELIVNITPIDDWNKWGYTLLGRDIMKPFRRIDNQYNEYNSYEEALEEALYQALLKI